MTATLTTTPASTSLRPAATPRVWRAGVAAGVAAAVATTAVAAAAHALHVSLETAPGTAIPAVGFGQLTLFFTAVGVLLARSIGRQARRPRSTFTRTALVLTALSFVPDMVLSTDVATKATLIFTHVVAAAIVIPALSSRVPEAVTN
jgi:hypothetical protein